MLAALLVLAAPLQWSVKCTFRCEGARGEVHRRVELANDELRCTSAFTQGELIEPAGIEGRADGSRTDDMDSWQASGRISDPAVVARHPGLAFGWTEARIDGDNLVVGLPGASGRAEAPSADWPGAGAHVDPLEDPLSLHFFATPDAILLPLCKGLAASARGTAHLTLDGMPLDLTWTERSLRATLDGVLFPTHPTLTLHREWRGQFARDDQGAVTTADIVVSTSVNGAKGIQRSMAQELELFPARDEASDPGGTRDALVHRASNPAEFWRDVLSKTAETARAQLHVVRPDADVGLVQVTAWLPGSVIPKTNALEGDFLKGAASMVAGLGLVSEQDAESVVDRWSGGSGGPDWASGVYLLDENVIAVRPAASGRVPVLVHEYAHAADASAERCVGDDAMPKTPDEGRIAAWGDLDSAIAEAARCEASAVLTEELASALAEHPEAASLAWKRIARAAGKEPAPQADLLDDLLDFLYGPSVRLLAARHVDGESLDATLDRAWRESVRTTRELINPASPGVRSELVGHAFDDLDALREAGAVGSTRVGALVLSIAARRRGIVGADDAQRLGSTLADDVVVRDAGGLTWITRWDDEGVAQSAERVLRRLVKEGARVERGGRQIVVRVGAPSETVLRLLTETPPLR